MKLYKVAIRVLSPEQKVSSIWEFRNMTGVGLLESKGFIEGVPYMGERHIVLSAERLGNYLAWRSLTTKQILLGFQLIEEYIEKETPPIFR